MNNRHRYDDKYDDGLGMDTLIGRHLKNYTARSAPPVSDREQLLLRALEQKVRSPLWMLFKAYFRAIGRLIWLVLSLRWLEAGNQEQHFNWIDNYVLEDHVLNKWFYHRTSMNSFLFGSGNFMLSG